MIICFFGDSIVNGVGDSDCLGWVGRLCAETRSKGHDITAYNLGVRKNSSRDILARWQEETERRMLPGVEMRLVFSFGAVDMVQTEDGTVNIPLEQSLDNARIILQRAASRFPTLFVGPPEMADPAFSARLQDLDAAYAGLCQELNVPCFRLLPQLKESEIHALDLANGDGIHPASAGYRLIFRLLEDWDGWQAWFSRRG